MIFWQLFSSFFKIGMFTIGGGYAMLALIQQEIVRHAWMTPQDFVDVLGIAEATPGPIAINAATFVGYRTAGIPGALVASLAVVFPSLLAVIVVSSMWERYKNSVVVQRMFAGIRPVVVGLVAAAAAMVGQATFEYAGEASTKVWTLLLAGASFYAVGIKKWDPIKVLLAGAALGFLIFQ